MDFTSKHSSLIYGAVMNGKKSKDFKQRAVAQLSFIRFLNQIYTLFLAEEVQGQRWFFAKMQLLLPFIAFGLLQTTSVLGMCLK